MTLVFKLMISLEKLFRDCESVSQSPLSRREISAAKWILVLYEAIYSVSVLHIQLYLAKIFYKHKGWNHRSLHNVIMHKSLSLSHKKIIQLESFISKGKESFWLVDFLICYTLYTLCKRQCSYFCLLKILFFYVLILRLRILLNLNIYEH